MKTLASDITFTDVPFTNNYKFDVLQDRYLLPIIPGLTEHIHSVKTRYSPVFYYYSGDTIIGQSLKHYGEYTQNEIDLLNHFINSGTVVYDIGANIGYHTIGLAQRSKVVHAFEPNNKNYFLLEHNTFGCTNVVRHNIAVGDEQKVVFVSDFTPNEHGNFGECMIQEDGVDTGQETQCYRLDDYVKQHNIPMPQLIKIDVEGYEWQVINGMKDIIENNLPIIFYEHLHGEHLPDIHEYLTQRGYKIYWFPAPNYNPNNYKRNRDNYFGNGGVLNALAVPFHMTLHTNLPEKMGKNETWPECIERLNKLNAQ